MEKQKATSTGLNLPISTKHAIEVCSLIRGRTVEQASRMLDEVIHKKRPVPFKRFNRDVGQKKGGVSSGRFPKKACMHVLKILKNGEANASQVGLASPYVVEEIRATRGVRNWKASRHRGRKGKSTHVYITITEGKKSEKKTDPAKKKAEKKEAKKK